MANGKTRKTRDAVKAAETADVGPPPGTGTDAPPRDTGVAAAVWAALVANPGAGATDIAAAAGVSRPTAVKALTALAEAGRATRITGSGTGPRRIPDTWHPAAEEEATIADNDGTGSGTDPLSETEPGGEVGLAGEAVGDGGGAAGEVAEQSSDPAAATGGDAEANTGTGDEDTHPGHDREDAPDAGIIIPAGDDSGPPAAAADHQRHTEMPQDIAPPLPDGEPALSEPTPSEPAASDPAPAAGTPQSADPAGLQEARQAMTDFTALVERAGQALAQPEADPQALVLAEQVYADAAKVRRLIKTALAGRPDGAARMRPGGLREKVAAHLTAHPDAEFSPHELGRALGHSSGAVSVALDKLAALGTAVQTAERPRRFAAAPAESSA
ncbi:hypothetical protein [Acrocarpospora sp. B8E8]|uniref:hypothetical protein n=1 Tax=Acrocarpospora sp. B8E8 TaxID=3153572 RepID=UPI00325E2ABA